jgi:hypothetical protein
MGPRPAGLVETRGRNARWAPVIGGCASEKARREGGGGGEGGRNAHTYLLSWVTTTTTHAIQYCAGWCTAFADLRTGRVLSAHPTARNG